MTCEYCRKLAEDGNYVELVDGGVVHEYCKGLYDKFLAARKESKSSITRARFRLRELGFMIEDWMTLENLNDLEVIPKILTKGRPGIELTDAIQKYIRERSGDIPTKKEIKEAVRYLKDELTWGFRT